MNKEIKLNKNIIFFDVETNGFQGSSVLSMRETNGKKFLNLTDFILEMKAKS